MTGTVHQVLEIARRSIVRTLRQPAQIIPNVTFPLLLLAINSEGLRTATELPGFPTSSFLDFFIPIAFIQGALFASGTAGVDLARDIDNGFLNRLALTPLRGVALLLGQLGGAVALGTIQATVYLGVGIAAGVRFESGVTGAIVLFVLAVLIALKTGSGEAVQSAFPLLFFLLFLSSMNLPRNLISIDWFRDLATANPVSYMIEALRTLVITGWDSQALVLGFLFTILMIVLGLLGSARLLKTRMART